MSRSMTVAQIAALVGGDVRGDAERAVTGIAPLHTAIESDITWITHARFRRQLDASRAGVVLLAESFGETTTDAIVCADVDCALALVLAEFGPPVAAPPIGVHPSAVVDESVVLGEGVSVGPLVVLDAGVVVGGGTILHAGVHVGTGSTIGSECRLWDHVVVREACSLGDRVEIHASSVIGSDGFGYYVREGRHCKVPHTGGVVIGDDVEIGACTCVDRSKIGDTVIGAGTKIDNLVQVAHNVEIGANSLLCAQVGIAGSTRLGKYVVLGGQAGVRDNVVIADGVMVAASTSIAHDVPAGVKMAGTPAVESRQFLRESASLRKLPGLYGRIKELAKRVDALEAAADDKPDG